jgi:hypothetical protein
MNLENWQESVRKRGATKPAALPPELPSAQSPEAASVKLLQEIRDQAGESRDEILELPRRIASDTNQARRHLFWIALPMYFLVVSVVLTLAVLVVGLLSRVG